MPDLPSDGDEIAFVVVAPLCVCNDEPMREDSRLPDRDADAWRFVCAECAAVVYVVEAPGVEPPAPALPTGERPGSAGKIQVMSERIGRGEGLYHLRDERVVARLADPEDGRATGRREKHNLPAGVTWDRSKNRYHVRVKICGHYLNVGRFRDVTTAARAAEPGRAGHHDPARAVGPTG
jgi:hypothetical protein